MSSDGSPVDPADGQVDVSRETAARGLLGEGYLAAQEYARILATDGIERGLVGPREGARIWERHVLNSAVLARLVTPGRVVDVGSGAGLPGIPLALARPDLEVVLLEPLLRRTRFLDEVIGRLGLAGRVTVVRGRAEAAAAAGLAVDTAVSRAVAPLERLVPWCLGLLRPAGVMLALKGDRAEPELAAVANRLTGMGASSWSLDLVGGDVLPEAVRVVRVVRRAG
jgi:16S rRNA (guanine527-N7)-methyltransferase